MSRENVEVVRRAFEFFGRGEVPFEVADPEIRIDNIPDWPIPGQMSFRISGSTWRT
ncbi:MAG: hypothetical protein QOE65_2792 [Solirubrobacteraceae bacterium]|jgi:hypothetical protein|nr:hypothetical protein [Solirubrobacteraceae bacterium]